MPEISPLIELLVRATLLLPRSEPRLPSAWAWAQKASTGRSGATAAGGLLRQRGCRGGRASNIGERCRPVPGRNRVRSFTYWRSSKRVIELSEQMIIEGIMLSVALKTRFVQPTPSMIFSATEFVIMKPGQSTTDLGISGSGMTSASID